MSTSKTEISWTDRTWNPVRGCSIASKGCINCYAARQAHRFSGPGGAYEGLTKPTSAGPQWTGQIATIESALLEPLSWRKPQRIFVNSMSDLFHEGVPDEFIERVFAVMALCPQHTFQILTKRAERMREYFTGPVFERVAEMALSYGIDRGVFEIRFKAPLPNVWLGVSVEDQPHADERIPLLLQTPAAVRFISAEPLLGPVELAYEWLFGERQVSEGDAISGFYKAAEPCTALDWVIVGGESGPGARPCDLAWVRSIVQQCQAAGVACFVKQLGSKPLLEFAPRCDQFISLKDRKGGDISEFPADLQVRQFPEVPS